MTKSRYLYLGIFICIILMFFSHFLVLAIAQDWNFITNPEQSARLSSALGLFSALFSGFAAFGLLYTIDQQREALRLQKEEAERSTALNLRLLHMELIKLSISDNDLKEVWEGDEKGSTSKQFLYVNLILSHWETMFEQGLFPEQRLLLLLEERMHGQVRNFWKEKRNSRRAHAERQGAATLKFHELVDQAYLATLTDEA